uniref:Uncharacterized protein n=1 Tax=Rhizophora mucronata TaxID=61149 RepID=A0A2P2NPX8_RHIMU
MMLSTHNIPTYLSKTWLLLVLWVKTCNQQF